MDVVGLIGIQLGVAFSQFTQWDEWHAFDVSDLMFVRFANVEHFDAKTWVVQSFFHVLHGYFVGMHSWFRSSGRQPAKIFIIDQFRERRMYAAQRTFRVAPQLQL